MKFLFLIFLCLFSGCDHGLYQSKSQIDEDEKLADLIMSNVGKDLRKKKGLVLCGTGGEMMYKIEMLALSFKYYTPLELEGGRELLIYAVNTLVDAVNANEKIRPYLANDPFGPKNVEIMIFPREESGGSVSSGNLCVMSFDRGILTYDIRDLETNRLKTIYRESLEEALRQVSEHHKQAM